MITDNLLFFFSPFPVFYREPSTLGTVLLTQLGRMGPKRHRCSIRDVRFSGALVCWWQTWKTPNLQQLFPVLAQANVTSHQSACPTPAAETRIIDDGSNFVLQCLKVSLFSCFIMFFVLCCVWDYVFYMLLIRFRFIIETWPLDWMTSWRSKEPGGCSSPDLTDCRAGCLNQLRAALPGKAIWHVFYKEIVLVTGSVPVVLLWSL